jgi:hypothetical protein
MRHYLLLLILPVCFIFFSVQLRLADGKYYNYGMADPSYVYLINSLSMAQMEGVGHIDHPGTPLQVTGAIIITIFHAFNHEKNDIAEDIIYRPEVYLNVIDITLIILNSIGLYMMGLIVYNVKKNISLGLLFQTIPFISINISEFFSQVKTENFAFFLIAIFISIMIKYVYAEDISPKKNYYYIIGTGILCGLILATKIGFICLVLIPVILFPEIKRKIIFISTVIFSFILFAIPAILNAGYFINWIEILIFHDQRYGRGSSSILNPQAFFNNIISIFTNEKYFTFVYLLIFIVLILFIFSKNKVELKQKQNSKELKFLIASFFTMSLQVLLVAKHYSHRYMYPALLLSVPGLSVAVLILYKKYFPKININIVFGIIFIFTFLFGAYNSRKIISRSRSRAAESEKIRNFISTNYPSSPVILSSGTSNEYAALILAYNYSPQSVKENYKQLINGRFPGGAFYDNWSNKLYSISNSFDVKNIFQSGKPVLFETTDGNFNANFVDNLKTNFGIEDASLNKVLSTANGELLYEVVLKEQK